MDSNWQTRLFEHVNSADGEFVWGKNDCITFAADAYKAIHGIDVIEDIRGTWTDNLSAARVIKEMECGDLGDAIATRLTEIEKHTIKRGDIVYCSGGVDGDFCAVVVGHMAVGPSSAGLQHVPISQVLRAFEGAR